MESINNILKATTHYFPRIILAIIVFIVFYLTANFLRKYTLKFYKKVFREQENVAYIISTSIYVALLLFGGFLSLEILELESVITKMLAGAGIVGVVLGFAFKEIGSNIIAGILINYQKPFKVGDWVDINGHYGTVLSLNTITTSIKNVNGQELFIPNHIIYKNIFTNYSSFQKRRVVLQSGVSYGDDLEKVKKVTLDEIKQIQSVIDKEDIDFYFTSIGSSAYNFEARFWIRFTQQTDYLEAMNEVIIRIKKRFEKENISIAYSVTTLDFGVKGGVNLFDKSIDIKK